MSLIHCIYCSAVASQDFGQQELDAILETSRRNNAAAGITGMLLYEGGSFFQVLEGETTAIDELFEKIEFDKRHHQVTKLISEPISERAFGEWSMGYPRVTRRDLEQIEGLNDFFAEGNSFLQLESGRAKSLLRAFQRGRWRV